MFLVGLLIALTGLCIEYEYVTAVAMNRILLCCILMAVTVGSTRNPRER